MRFDPKTGRLVRVAKLNFTARNLAAVKETHPIPHPAVAERTGL